MKKSSIIKLIKYHAEGNDNSFREEAYKVARYFHNNGDEELSHYIMAQLSSVNTFVPQINETALTFFKKDTFENDPLPLPDPLKDDITGIINAIGHNVGVNKFLFQGFPGTGKTATARQIAKILGRDLFLADFTSVIDCKLGQTAKNISQMFRQMNMVSHPENAVFLFDEIDALALDRTNTNDLREMGRAASEVIKGLDSLSDDIVIIATTNLYGAMDKAISRRFDKVVDFNRYSQEDLREIAVILLSHYLGKFTFAATNMRLFKKIISLMNPLPNPGELKNYIKISLAFSRQDDGFDYLKRMYKDISKNTSDLAIMRKQGFTLREIEILTNVSKSQVSREVNSNE